jgi:hypothetical protein
VSVTGSPADDPGIEFSPMPDDPSQGPLPAPSTPVATRTAVPLPSKSATPPSASPSPPKTSPTPAAPIVTFTAVGGYGCSSANTGYSSNDRDTTQGWYSSGSGGWNKDGCSGAFDSMPMSGSATTADPTQYADWAFTVGSASKTCDLSAYVPKYSGDAKRSAGNPAHYAIGDSQGSAGKGTFTIDQIASGGKWLSIKTVAVSGGKLWVRVDNRGIDWGASDGYHIGLGQFKVVCHA